jgi:hypothetical protein
VVPAAVAPGLLIGTALGLLGGGGSVLTVPIFVYILGFEAKDAIAMSLAVVGLTSIVGTLMHWREENVNARIGVPFGAVATVGTFAGARVGVLLPSDLQLAIFAGVMLAAALFMARGGWGKVSEASMPVPGGLAVSIVFGGLLVGFLTGVVGVGGGFLIVPALVMIGLPMREAVGTSLLIIAANCAVGLLGYAGHVNIVWPAVALVAAFTIPGIAIGAYLHRHVPQHALRAVFSIFLIVVAVFILYQNVPAVLAFREP